MNKISFRQIVKFLPLLYAALLTQVSAVFLCCKKRTQPHLTPPCLVVGNNLGIESLEDKIRKLGPIIQDLDTQIKKLFTECTELTAEKNQDEEYKKLLETKKAFYEECVKNMTNKTLDAVQLICEQKTKEQPHHKLYAEEKKVVARYESPEDYISYIKKKIEDITDMITKVNSALLNTESKIVYNNKKIEILKEEAEEKRKIYQNYQKQKQKQDEMCHADKATLRTIQYKLGDNVMENEEIDLLNAMQKMIEDEDNGLALYVAGSKRIQYTNSKINKYLSKIKERSVQLLEFVKNKRTYIASKPQDLNSIRADEYYALYPKIIENIITRMDRIKEFEYDIFIQRLQGELKILYLNGTDISKEDRLYVEATAVAILVQKFAPGGIEGKKDMADLNEMIRRIDDKGSAAGHNRLNAQNPPQELGQAASAPQTLAPTNGSPVNRRQRRQRDRLREKLKVNVRCMPSADNDREDYFLDLMRELCELVKLRWSKPVGSKDKKYNNAIKEKCEEFIKTMNTRIQERIDEYNLLRPQLNDVQLDELTAIIKRINSERLSRINIINELSATFVKSFEAKSVIEAEKALKARQKQEAKELEAKKEKGKKAQSDSENFAAVCYAVNCYTIIVNPPEAPLNRGILQQ